ncbi:hypothetical protein DAI22_01g210900 [Oryza sativa Japonica Group]|nr:hypothetical protein DAI22_01g210900 [Oryza sativa Japonica Group]
MGHASGVYAVLYRRRGAALLPQRIFFRQSLPLATTAAAPIISDSPAAGAGGSQRRPDFAEAMQRANRRRQRSRSGRGGRIPGGERAGDAYSCLQVHFTGKRLDGTLFTSTIEDGVPLTFILGQGILKKTMKRGVGNDKPCDLDEVLVNYNACLEDGMSVSMSEGVEFNLAEGFFCPAFARAVETMTEGEEVVLIVKLEYGFGERGRPSIGDEAAVPPDATLYVYLQLMSWKTVRHIGQNGTILKKTLRRGNLEGQHTENQAVVGVRLIGKLHDGAVFDQRGHQGDEPFEFVVDEEQVSDGLEEAVLTMWEGEVSLFTIPPQCLQDQHDKHPWLMSQAESVEAAVEKEKEGDKLFGSSKYLRAYRRYYKARQIILSCFRRGGHRWRN